MPAEQRIRILTPEQAAADIPKPSTAIGAALSSTFATRGIYENFSPQNFRRFRAALARQRAGGAVARIGAYGDSNSNGYQAADATALYSRGYAARAREILNKEFAPSRDGIIFSRIGGANGKPDQRFTLGAGWTEFTATDHGPAGSGSVVGTGITAGTLDVALPDVNSFTVYLPRFSNGATSVSIWIDNEAATVVSVNGVSAMLAITVTTSTVGAHVLRVKIDSTGSAYVQAVEGYDSTTPAMRWTAVGRNGGTANEFNFAGTAPWNPQQLTFGPSVPVPDLIFLNLSINSHNAGVGESAYKAPMSILIAKAKAVADVILVASAAGGYGSAETWPSYLQWQRDLAATHGCGVINMQDRWGTYALANSAPYSFWSDPDHPTLSGYWDMGQAVAEAVRLAAGRSA